VDRDWTGSSPAEESLIPKLTMSQLGCSIAQAANTVLGCTNKCVVSRTRGITSTLGGAEVSVLCRV